MAVFRGLERQKGHGLGNVIKSVGRFLVPLLAKHLGSLKKEAVHSGIGLASEIMSGENPKKAFKSAVKKTIKGTVNRIQRGGKKKPRKRGLMGRWVKKIKKDSKRGPPGKRGYKRKRKSKKRLSSRKTRQEKTSSWGILQ